MSTACALAFLVPHVVIYHVLVDYHLEVMSITSRIRRDILDLLPGTGLPGELEQLFKFLISFIIDIMSLQQSIRMDAI